MSSVKSLESTVEGWYKSANLPHLPKNGQKWLAHNIWWLALIGAILSVLGIIVIIPAFLAAVSISTIAVGVAPTYVFGGLFWLSALVSVAGYVATTVILIMSISPLKELKERGWSLLFLSYVLNFGFSVVSALVTVNIGGILMAILTAAVAGYFLFEIKSYFFGKLSKIFKRK